MKLTKNTCNKQILNINSINKTIVIIILIFLIASSVSAFRFNSQENMFPPMKTTRNIIWDATLMFSETGGKNDYIIFGEASDASDDLDSYDTPNPPGGPEPFLDAYFTTNFPYPYNSLLQEIKVYPDTYKIWNFTVLWSGEDTTVTITWNTTDVDESEYDTIGLYDGIGALLVDMLTSNNYTFFCSGSELISFQIIATANAPPILSNPFPANDSMGIERPPAELRVIVEDPDGDTMDVYLRWRRHDFYHSGEWFTIQTYIDVGNGTYNFTIPEVNDWIWGNTTYNWSVNATDPSGSEAWTNKTYQYTTSGSRYDVNNNDRVNFQDAGLVWIHRSGEADYDGIYDVTFDGQVNFQDAGLTWVNRD